MRFSNFIQGYTGMVGPLNWTARINLAGWRSEALHLASGIFPTCRKYCSCAHVSKTKSADRMFYHRKKKQYRNASYDKGRCFKSLTAQTNLV